MARHVQGTHSAWQIFEDKEMNAFLVAYGVSMCAMGAGNILARAGLRLGKALEWVGVVIFFCAVISHLFIAAIFH
jgi:uncharacterized membrane protein